MPPPNFARGTTGTYHITRDVPLSIKCRVGDSGKAFSRYRSSHSLSRRSTSLGKFHDYIDDVILRRNVFLFTKYFFSDGLRR